MPMYEFVCQVCGKHKDIIVKFSESEDPQPCDCSDGAEMFRDEVISRPGFKWLGRWHKTTGNY